MQATSYELIRSGRSLPVSAFHRWLALIELQPAVCLLILAFFAMQGAVPFIANNQALEVNNAPPSSLTFWGGIGCQIAIYTCICIFICSDYRLLIRWLATMRWAAAIACLAIVSSAWSQFPGYTLRRAVPFALAGLFGAHFALKYSLRRQLSILWASMLMLALATIVLALFFPHYGLDVSAGHQGDWQGAFTSKNGCGRIMVLATAVVLSVKKQSAWRTLSLVLFTFIVAMSGSRGAWVIDAIVLGIYFGLRILTNTDKRSRVVLIVFSIAAGFVLASSVAIHYAEIASLLGRDATLTGRTWIWKQIWPFILRRPILGWGYSGFWRGVHGESFRVIAFVRFILFHAHNGFLEIWLELGGCGLLLFAASYFRGWRKLWPHLRRGAIRRVMSMLFMLVLVGLYDLDENTLLIYNGLFWVLYVSALVNIELLAIEDRIAGEAAVLFQSVDMPDKRAPIFSSHVRGGLA